MCVHVLLLFSCVHSLGLVRARSGENLRSGKRRECTRAHARIAELPKIKRQLILNNTRISHLLLTAYDFRGNCDVLLLKKTTTVNWDYNKSGLIFSHALVTVRNDLLLDICRSSSISLFKNRLKIHIFNMAFIDVPNID